VSNPGRYVRTQPGGGGYGVIHRAECRTVARAKHLQEWEWPEGRGFQQLLTEMRARGSQDHLCRVCFPRRDGRGWGERSGRG